MISVAQMCQPRWLSGLRRSRVHSLVIARDSIIEHDISSSDVEQLGGVIHTRDELTSPNDDSECEDVNPMSDISTGPCVNSSTSVQTGETLDVISNLVQNLVRALHYPDQLDT